MKRALLAIVILLGYAGVAAAQDDLAAPGGGAAGAGGSMGELIADGYEIKAAAPNGAKYVVFLQNEKKAFACEFVTLSNSRCGEIK